LGVDEDGLIAQPRAAVVPSARRLVLGAELLDFGGVSADDEQPGRGVGSGGPARGGPRSRG